LERYGQLGQYAIKYLGDTELQSLAPMAIESMLNNLLDSGGRKDETIRTVDPFPENGPSHRLSGSRFPRVRCEVGHSADQSNGPTAWFLPKAEKKELRALDKEGLSQLLGAVSGTSLFPLFVTAASTGCRRGELLALEWRDVDFQTGTITISKSLEQTKNGLRIKSTKSGKARRFLLPSVARGVLLHRRNQQQENPIRPARIDRGLVFCSPEGTYYKPDQISSRIAEITAKAGLRGISLHSLRHGHASQLLSQGVPIPTVSKRLGHANPSITLRLYSHALESDELAAAKLWNDAFADVVDAHANGRQ
jgi:integrase